MFHVSFMDRKFQGCSKKASGVLQGCFEEVFRDFEGFSKKFKEVLELFGWCFKKVSKVLQTNFW